ncbi:hypothetical protein RN001_001000 [Aquatica leii]|uniref:Uncharacterized protein n=1 Tax=Aquatica leii TaxID=1421715 RepID=A0AAN7SKY2_9COLE|nr:hypothetical protein RN001_001000 [Aquatica leii]
MSASTILNLFGCGVFREDELVQVYEDICERMVLHGEIIDQEDEVILMRLIEKVTAIKSNLVTPSTTCQPNDLDGLTTEILPSTSRDVDYYGHVGMGYPINEPVVLVALGDLAFRIERNVQATVSCNLIKFDLSNMLSISSFTSVAIMCKHGFKGKQIENRQLDFISVVSCDL